MSSMSGVSGVEKQVSQGAAVLSPTGRTTVESGVCFLVQEGLSLSSHEVGDAEAQLCFPH